MLRIDSIYAKHRKLSKVIHFPWSYSLNLFLEVSPEFTFYNVAPTYESGIHQLKNVLYLLRGNLFIDVEDIKIA